MPVASRDDAIQLKQQGKTIAQIAEILQKPLGSVKSWLYSQNHIRKSSSIKELSRRVEQTVTKRLQNNALVGLSNSTRTMLAREAELQARLLARSKPILSELYTTTGKDGSQGRTALAKQLAEMASMVFDWSSDKPHGTLDLSAPREIRATVVSDTTTSVDMAKIISDAPKP